MPYKDPEKQREAVRKGVHDFRVRQSEKQAQKDAWIAAADTWMDEVGGLLKDSVIRDWMAQGKTRAEAEDMYHMDCMPPDLWEEDEPQSLEAASDLVSEDKPCNPHAGIPCPNFGRAFHTDSDPCQRDCTVKAECQAAYVAQSKPQPEIDVSERIERNKYLVKAWLEMRAAKRATDSSEKARGETRQEMERTKAIVDTVAKTMDVSRQIPDRANAEKIRVLTIQREHEQKYHDWPKIEKRTRGDEYGKPIPLYSHTVPDVFGKTKLQILSQQKEEDELFGGKLNLTTDEKKLRLKEKAWKDNKKVLEKIKKEGET